MSVYLGFDPGGESAFGWCVAADAPQLPLLRMSSGVTSGSVAAVARALSAVSPGEAVLAVGIDAPLVWSRDGTRRSDEWLRKAIRRGGAPYTSGTVQAINSLRGACLVEGILAALEIRELRGAIPISESHPKALRWLCSEAWDAAGPSEHERDALVGTYSAWAVVHKPAGWSDLYLMSERSFSLVPPPIHYFMPVQTT